MKNGAKIQSEKIDLASAKNTEAKSQALVQIQDALLYIKKGLVRNIYLF